MIARDEEATIGMTIKSVLALVDEVIVVDTGSRDNSRIIAEGYGARVIDLPWSDDFSVVRNATLAEATGDWILVLDADEHLQPIRPVEFQRLLHDDRVAGYRLNLVCSCGAKSSYKSVRLFRNHSQIRYRYPVYEQIQPALAIWAQAAGQTIQDASLTILHDGNDQDKRSQRRDRNQRILRRAQIDYPDEPYFDFRLAGESIVLLDDEVLPVAGLNMVINHLDGAWRKAAELPDAERRTLPYGPDLTARFCAALLACERIPQARRLLAEGRELFGDHPALLLQSVAATARYLHEYSESLADAEKADLLAAARRDIHVLQAARLDTLTTPMDSRCQTLYPLRYLGELALFERRVSKAAEFFEKALTIDNAYSFAWLGLAECARYAGDRKRALKLYLRAVTENEWNHQAWLRGCTLLEELDFRDNAASWRHKVGIHFPEHPSVRDQGAGSGETPALVQFTG